MNVYTRQNGKLLKWEVDTSDPAEAIALVRAELPSDHKEAILAVVKT
jgi:hypothetical protein